VNVASLWAADLTVLVDYLETHPAVDPQRLGAAGCSGGGVQAAYIGALDQRLAAVSGAVRYLMQSTLTEIYLCHACSCQEIEDENAPAGERGVLHVDADDRLQAVHLYPHPQWRRRAG
jgi:hypothetical protein